MGQYKTGTCAVTNASITVTITGATADASAVAVGNLFKTGVAGDAIYQVASRTPASGATLTSITLSAAYGGTTQSGLTYQITKDFSVNRSYVLPAQGDANAGDWIAKSIAKIDADVGAILSTSAAPTLANNQVAFFNNGLTGSSNLTWNGSLLGVGGTAIDNLTITSAVVTTRGLRTTAGLSLEDKYYVGGAGVDSKYWRWLADSTTFHLQTLNDAYSATVDAFSITRSGNSITSTVFPGAINAANFQIGSMATTDAGTVGFTNANGPSVVCWGTGSANAGLLELKVSGTTAATINTMKQLSVTTIGQTSTLLLTDTGINGVNLKLTGDGATTPAKYLRVNAGALQVINSAYGAVLLTITDAGNLGIGLSPTAQLQLSTDSAVKPTTNTWTIASDERLKRDIVPADLARCYEMVKRLPLKKFTWKETVYTPEQAQDRSKIGWIANDVQAVFPKSVGVAPFHCVPVEDGVQESDEQIIEEVAITKTVIEIVNGVPIQKTQTVMESRPAVDLVPVVDEAGIPVMERQPALDAQGQAVLDEQGQPVIHETPRLHPVPRMHKVSKPKLRTDEIADCLNLNTDQIYAAMYGAIQLLMQKVEALERNA